MKLKNNKSGFTLLEIIIVVIIVGVLASLALPRLFATLDTARGTEALNAIGVLKRGADECALTAQMVGGVLDYTNCNDFGPIGRDDPGTAPGALFGYAINVNAGPPVVWSVQAQDGGGDTIDFFYDVVAGTTWRVGTGPYANLR